MSPMDLVGSTDVPVVVCFAFALLLWCVRDWLQYRSQAGIGYYWPVIGHLPTIVRAAHDPLGLTRCRFRSLGWPSALLFKAGIFEPTARYFIVSPQDVEHTLKTNFENYRAGWGQRADAAEEAVGNGIFRVDGAAWLKQRVLLSREFGVERFHGLMLRVFNKMAHRMVDTLERRLAQASIEKKKEGRGEEDVMPATATVDMQDLLFRLTLTAICEVALGVDLGDFDGKKNSGHSTDLRGTFPEDIERLQQLVVNRTIGDVATWRMKRFFHVGSERELLETRDRVDRFVYALIDRARNAIAAHNDTDTCTSASESSLLSRLCATTEEKEEGINTTSKDIGSPLDRRLVRDLLLSFLVAGSDTTASGMTYALLELGRHPKVVDDVLEELQACAGIDAGVDLGVADAARCHFLQAVLSETQRLHPAIPFNPRAAANPDVLPGSGVHIQRGDTVAYANYAMGVNPAIWGPRAETFDPARWIQADGTCSKEDPCRYPVFHAGRRLCLGMDMAQLEMKVVLAHLLSRFEFQLPPGASDATRVSAVLRLRDGLPMAIRKRFQS